MSFPSQYPSQASLKTLLSFAVPVCIAELAMMLMQVVDTWVVGRLGVAEIGGTSAGGIFFHIFFVAGIGAASGMEFWVSFNVGAKKYKDTVDYLVQALWIAFGYSLVTAVLIGGCYFFLPDMGFDPSILPHARRFLVWVPLMIFPGVGFMVIRSFLQAYGVTTPQLVLMIVMNIVNFALVWTFALGQFGFPRLGVVGAAVSTTLVRWLAFGAIAGVTWRMVKKHPETREHSYSLAFERQKAKQVLSLGLPSSGHYLLEVGIFAFATYLVGRMGSIELATHQIVLNLASLCFMIPLGISLSTAVLVGNSLGKGCKSLARSYGYLALKLGVGVMVFVGFMAWIFSESIMRSFSSEARVVELGVRLIVMVFAFQVFDATQVIMAGALRGLGTTRQSFLANLFGHWIVAFPVMMLFTFALGYGVFGIWTGLLIGLASVAITLVWVWERKSRVP